MILPLSSKNKPLHLILDAGHGWNTPGKNSDDEHTITNNNDGKIKDATFREFEYNEAIVNKIALLCYLHNLQGNDISYSFVSQEHYDVSLKTRVERANEIHKKYKDTHRVIFISVHANAFSDKTARGYSIHIAEKASDTSKRFADLMDIHLNNVNNKYRTGIYSRGVLKDDFYVIKNTNCPAILIECGFMTNELDLKYLMDESYRNAIAVSIFNCAIDFTD